MTLKTPVHQFSYYELQELKGQLVKKELSFSVTFIYDKTPVKEPSQPTDPKSIADLKTIVYVTVTDH